MSVGERRSGADVRKRARVVAVVVASTAVLVGLAAGCVDGNLSCDACDWATEYCSVEHSACGQDGLVCGGRIYAFCVPFPDECGATPTCGCLHPIYLPACESAEPSCKGSAAEGFTLETYCS